MPREQIVYPRVAADTAASMSRDALIEEPEGWADAPKPPPPPQPVSFPVPHVTWHGGVDTGGWIQIMFECDRQFLADLMKDLPADQQLVEIHSEVLDREAANRLIRAGRRARDHAYGRDE